MGTDCWVRFFVYIRYLNESDDPLFIDDTCARGIRSTLLTNCKGMSKRCGLLPKQDIFPIRFVLHHKVVKDHKGKVHKYGKLFVVFRGLCSS